MVDRDITEKCKQRLVDFARQRRTIFYSDLAECLGVANQSVGRYLNEIYAEEMALGHPDLTIVAVYAETGIGRYNSRGNLPQSVRVNPHHQADVAAYKAELQRVYDHWANR